LHFSNGGRTSLIDQFAQLERKYQQSVDTTTWEINEIKYRNMRRMKLISSLLLIKKLTNLANQRYFATLVKIKT
jgi:FtsZ-binding cell division protein ZapB